MKENTNKAIVINTIILYIRLGVCVICGLIASRFALQALGVDDFGIFSVVGSVISLIAVINTVMLSTSNRFIAVAIGKGNINDINEQFNVNFIIHLFIALIIAAIAVPIGDWYIVKFVNYEGNIENVIKVFNITIWGSVISFIGVPFNGLLMAQERFFVFCATDVICHLLKLFVCYLLMYYFLDKLLIYSLALTLLAVMPTIIYGIYCHIRFPNLVKFKFVKDVSKYKSVINFSIWIGYGAVATVGKTQGSALIVNAFFNTAMNAALGLANTINGLLVQLAGNVSSSISPQITKSYSAGDLDRATELTCMSSKISFMFMLIVSSPFLLTPDFIFKLWLSSIPDYLIIFSQLLIVDTLIGTLNRGVPELIFATGNIKWYQIIVNTLFILSVVVAYFVLKSGMPAYYMFITYIVFSLIILVIRQVVLTKITKINNKLIIKKSYAPSLVIVILYIPFLIFHPSWNPIVLNIVSIIYIITLIIVVGLSKTERQQLFGFINSILKRRI